MGNLMLLENPIYRYRSYKNKTTRRNPMKSIEKFTGGVGIIDIAGGAAGLAVSTLVPNYIFKALGQSAPNKWFKVLVAAAATVGAGYLAKKFYPSMAKSIVIGGLAGTASQVIFNVSGKEISRAAIGALPIRRAIGSSLGIGQTTKPEFEGMPSL
jgi:hypothetical protein